MSRRPNLEAREKIVCEAYRLIFTQGFKGASMDDVAEAAGLKKANLFHYYPTKEALALAVFDYTLSRLQSTIQANLGDGQAEPIEAVAAMFDQASGRMTQSGCCGGCFVGNVAQELSDHNESLRQRVAEHMRQWRDHWARYFASHKERGYFRDDFDPQLSASGLLSLFEGAMIFCKANKSVVPIEDAKRMALAHFNSFRAYSQKESS